MKPVRFVALAAIVYLALGLLAECGTEPDPPTQTSPAIILQPIPTIPIGTLPPATTSMTTSTTSTTVTTAHDAMQADLEIFDALDAVDPDTPCQEWLPVAISAGWPADPAVLETLGRVLWKESRCTPLQYGDPGTHNWDVGIAQINQIHREYVEQIFGEPYETAMSDPWKNLHFAYRLWQEREDRGRCGFQPWSLPCTS